MSEDNGNDTLTALAGAALAGADSGAGGDLFGSDSTSSGDSVASGQAAQGLSEALNGAGIGPSADVVGFADFVKNNIDKEFALNPAETPQPPVTVEPSIPYLVSIVTPSGKRVALPLDAEGTTFVTTSLEMATAVQNAANAYKPECQAVKEVVDAEAKSIYGLE